MEVQKKQNAKVTKGRLICDLRSLGIAAGDTVFFHSSMKRIGYVEGGPDTVIDALLEVVGPDGTLVVPTLVRAMAGPREPFDPASTPSEVGLLTETLRRRREALRSNHPTHSVAAIGARAKQFTQDHPAHPARQTPWGDAAFSPGSPWDLLVQSDVKYLLIGVDFSACTLFHYVQASYVEEHQHHYARSIPFPLFDFTVAGELLTERGCVQQGTLGDAPVLLSSAGRLFQELRKILEQHPKQLHPAPAFADWLSKVKGRSLTLQGGAAIEPLRLCDSGVTSDGTSMQARVLYIRDHNEPLIIVSLTLLGLSNDASDAVRKAVADEIGCASSQVLVACSHVHSVPPEPGHVFPEQVPHIIGACTRAADRARQAAVPVRVGVAQRIVDGVARIRRIKTADGRTASIRRAVPSTWHRTYPRPEFWQGPEEEFDATLTVLRVEDQWGKPVACLTHFPCHPNPDFMGFAADFVERTMGDSFVCLITAGALGNVDVPFEVPRRGKVQAGLLPYLGEVMSYAVLETLARAEVEDGGSVRSTVQTVFLSMHSACERLREIAMRDPAALLECEEVPCLFGRPDSPDLVDFLRAGGFATQVMAAQVGPLCLVAVPGEPPASLTRDVSEATARERLCILGLANGFCGYLMGPEARERGGYECEPRFAGVTSADSLGLVRAAAIQCIHRLTQAAEADPDRASSP